MDGRAFLDSAQRLVSGRSEPDWRTAAGRAYYALVLEGRTALRRWGFAVPRRDSMHAFVRLRFVYASDPDLKLIGDALDKLVRLRNDADYEIERSGRFTDVAAAREAIQKARDAIDLLDQIEADPTRRAAAIADVRGTLPP